MFDLATGLNNPAVEDPARIIAAFTEYMDRGGHHVTRELFHGVHGIGTMGPPIRRPHAEQGPTEPLPRQLANLVSFPCEKAELWYIAPSHSMPARKIPA